MKNKFIVSVFIFLICFLFQNSYAQQDVNGWYWSNGRPTGNQLKWVRIFDANNMFAVGDRGTFMKSTNGGDTWSVNNQAGSPDISVGTGGGATRILNTGWFFDGNTGYVAGQSLSAPFPSPGYVRRTINGGNTFTNVTYNDTGGTINGMYFIDNNTGYFCGGTRARIHKTVDGGLTWTDISLGMNNSNTWNNIMALDTGNVFVCTSTKRVFYHKTGLDSAWKVWNLPGSSATITDVYFKDANTGYACGNGNYFAYTLDGGTTWTQSNPPSTVGQQRMKYYQGNIYLVGAYTEIYKSSNDGVSWTALNFIDGGNSAQPTPFIMYGIDAFFDTGLNILNIAVVGSNGIVNISNDGGTTWGNKNYSVYAQNNLYVSVFSLGGKVWVGPSFTDVTVPLLYSANGGNTWGTQATSHTTAIRGIDFVNANTGFICGGRFQSSIGEFSTTSNGGTTWNFVTLPSPQNTHQMYALDFVNENTGWVVGGIPGIGGTYDILKTTTGGASFTTQTLNVATGGPAFSIKMIDSNIGYLLATTGLFSTTDGGATWIKNTNSYLTGISLNCLSVLTKDIIFVGSSSTGAKRIIRSLDGGQTWVDLSANLLVDASPFNLKFINLKHGVMVGTNGYTARTSNGGVNWTATNPGVSTLVDLSLPDKNTLYSVCDRNTSFPLMRKLENITSISVNANTYIEGLWNGKPMVQDTVRLYLANSTSPFSIIDSAIEYVNINGYATYEFYNASPGSYYIVARQRNSLETWSANPITMAAGGNYNIDFSDPTVVETGNNAYCNNQVLKSGKYCMYSGDVNQDGIIDIGDLTLVDNDAFNFAAGYLPTDLDGNLVIDLSDMAIADNNAYDLRQVKSPITGCP